jgi:hypothetical protein
MKDFLLLKKDQFKVDADGNATVIEKPNQTGRQLVEKKKKPVVGANKSTCEVIQLD